VLLEDPDEEDEPGYPLRLGGAMLRELGELINRFGLVVDLPEGETLHWVRPHRLDEDPTSAKCLGTPPPRKASQSRMSPAGIPMFYGATDLDTAYAETITAATEAAKAVTFTTTRAARIVDLDRLPSAPSFFDLSEQAVRDRPSLGFLAGFRRDVSAPIEHDDRIHIDYVPTQIVGEYLRHLFRDGNDRPIGVECLTGRDRRPLLVAAAAHAEAAPSAAAAFRPLRKRRRPPSRCSCPSNPPTDTALATRARNRDTRPMGFLNNLLGRSGGSPTPCPVCDTMMKDLYGDGSRYECHGSISTRSGTFKCGAGPWFRDENGNLYDVNDPSRKRHTHTCRVCDEPLSREDGDLPYADGSTPDGVIVCPNGHKNIFDFGME
jgi:hypothetical protein